MFTFQVKGSMFNKFVKVEENVICYFYLLENASSVYHIIFDRAKGAVGLLGRRGPLC